MSWAPSKEQARGEFLVVPARQPHDPAPETGPLEADFLCRANAQHAAQLIPGTEDWRCGHCGVPLGRLKALADEPLESIALMQVRSGIPVSPHIGEKLNGALRKLYGRTAYGRRIEGDKRRR